MTEGTTRRKGACHCGAVRFTVALPSELSGGRCNCSICSMKGSVTVGVPAADLELTSGIEWLGTYQFNTMTAEHHFCTRCGIHVYHRRRLDPRQVGINAACLDGVSPYDFAEVPVADGVHHPLDNDGKSRQVGTLRFEQAEN